MTDPVEYVLVPKVPTNKMQVRGLSALDESDATPPAIGHQIGYKAIRELWAAMLEEAPQPTGADRGMLTVAELASWLRQRDPETPQTEYNKGFDTAADHLFRLAIPQPSESREARLVGLLREVRKWLGDGEHEQMHRSIWTPAYTQIIDAVDAELAAGDTP